MKKSVFHQRLLPPRPTRLA